MVEISELSFGYRKRELLYENLNLSLESGSICGLLGKNGAGKSTLIKILSGLVFPKSGRVVVNQYEPRLRQPSFLQNIYFVPEQVYVPPLTAVQYAALHAPFYPLFDNSKYQDYLTQFEVDAGQKISRLSFGQQKKFIIAFALACQTAVLLMDEPTNGLDIPSKSQFRKVLASAISDERLFFISTHQTRDLDNLIDRVLIVNDGEILLNADLETIAQTLDFKLQTAPPEGEQVLYSEPSGLGYVVVSQNTEGVDSRVNLEYLFNAVTAQPIKIHNLFSSLAQA